MIYRLDLSIWHFLLLFLCVFVDLMVIILPYIHDIGGAAVTLLVSSPAAEGLFHRAIPQSGSSVDSISNTPTMAVDSAKLLAKEMGEYLGTHCLYNGFMVKIS